jgi:hypothetical protein
MTGRERLPNRRRSITFGFQCNNLSYTTTASFYPDGRLGEIFLGNHRCDSHADACAKDSAILATMRFNTMSRSTCCARHYCAMRGAVLIRQLAVHSICWPPTRETHRERVPSLPE